MTEDIDTQAVVFRKAMHGLAAAMLPQAQEHAHIKLAAEILLDVADVFTDAEHNVRHIEEKLSQLDAKEGYLDEGESTLYSHLDGKYWALSDLLDEVSALLTVDTAQNRENQREG